MDRIRIRRMTTSDKENVLAMRDNTKPGPDSLPAYFDHYASIPNAYPAGLFYDEKLAGFSVGHIVDDGMTGVLRASRVSPEFEGRGLMKILHRHVADWARNSGVQSIVSLSDEVPGHTGSERPKRFDKTVFTWRWAQLTFRPDKQKRREDNETSELEKVSDDNLSVILNDEKTRDYIAPRGIMLLHWTPLKPIVENISTIRGIEGSTNIYSDIKPGPDRCTGLLTCCTKYKAARESQMDFKCCLDIFGTDSSSLQKHVVKHFNDIKRTSENDAGLKIVLPEGIEWNEVIPNFTELDIDMENNAEFLNVHMAEWWRSPNSASVNPELYRTADLCLCFRICKKPVFS